MTMAWRFDGPKTDPGTGGAAAPRTLDVAALMDGARTVRLEHRGELYVLRVTRAGKLILTK